MVKIYPKIQRNHRCFCVERSVREGYKESRDHRNNNRSVVRGAVVVVDCLHNFQEVAGRQANRTFPEGRKQQCVEQQRHK